MRTFVLFLGAVAASFWAGCSSDGSTCTTTSGGAAGDAGLFAPCAAPDGGSSGSGGSGSGSGGSSSGGSSGGGSSGGSSGGLSGSSGSGSGSSSGGGENCQPGQGDFCLCYGASSTFPANDTACSTTTLKDPGTCCAAPGFPGQGDCICSAFLCYVNSGGGKDCFFQDLGGNGLEVPTTSASGTACCVWGASTSGFICSCYDDADLCEGKQSVSECTIDTVPPCSSDVTVGYTQVPACR